jgi:hypothetical protein
MDRDLHGGSVTHWLAHLKAGDPAAAKALWDGYFARLVELARTRLRAGARAAADEEDVALSAFDSFYRGAGEGRFPRLDDRDDLWRASRGPSRHRNSRPPSPTSARTSSGCSAMGTCGRWRSGRWRASPTRRSPRS